MKNQFNDMGMRIKKRRKELKMKQNDLAEMLGISTNHMSSIETGKQIPSLDIFVHICEQLHATPDYLLLGSMYANNIRQNIIDGLRLCSDSDIELIREIVEIMIKRNGKDWNKTNFI